MTKPEDPDAQGHNITVTVSPHEFNEPEHKRKH